MEYAFISHGTAVMANRAISRNRDFEALDDEGIWQIAEPRLCITTQGAFKRLAREISLENYGIAGRPVHLLVPSAASRSRGRDAEFHVWAGLFPEHAFIQAHERLFVSSPLFTAIQLALLPRPTKLKHERAAKAIEEERRIRSELGVEDLLADERDMLRWEGIARQVDAARIVSEFSGTYRLPSKMGGRVLYGVAPSMTCAALSSFLDGQPAMRGSMKGHAVASLAFDGAASPMETALALLLTLPVAMGGYGVVRPELNKAISLEEGDRALSSQAEMVADLCWPEEKLIVEYDSWEWHGGARSGHLAHDRARANALTAMGWRVLSVGYEQISSIQGMNLLARQVAALLGRDLEKPDDLRRIWRSRLHTMLMPVSDRLR